MLMRYFRERHAFRAFVTACALLGLGCGGGSEGHDTGAVSLALDGTVGSFDRVSRQNMHGYACNPANPTTAATVHFFGVGFVPLGTGLANFNREDAVGTACGGNVAHGFRVQTPAALLDGLDHWIYAYFDAAHTRPLPGSPIL